MNILSLDPYGPDPKLIQEAVRVLRRGGIVMYPTDTAYGLAADMTNPKGVRRIYQIKGRSKDKTLPLIAASRAMVSRHARWNPRAEKLAKKYWPGPLTILLQAKQNHTHIIKDGKIAIRVPDAPVAQKLSRALGRPITSTSANKSGSLPSYSVQSFLRQMKRQRALPDIILDAGALPPKKPSTIVDATKIPPVLIRKGPVKI